MPIFIPVPNAPVGPMTFLSMAQRLQQESGTSGSTQTTVANATGEWKRLCDWIAQAYVEIQLKRDDWNWMEQDVVFDTIAGQQSYSPNTSVFTTPAGTGIADFRSWKLNSTTGEDSFRLYLKSAGVNNETFLDASLNYTRFRDYYILGAKRNVTSRPVSICVDPQKNLLLGLTPNDVYTVNGKYYQTPSVLANDTDTPAFPARYHMLIVYRALEKYGMFESAPEVVSSARTAGDFLMDSMIDEQLPPFELPDPLVS